jgi:hypothetical protein
LGGYPAGVSQGPMLWFLKYFRKKIVEKFDHNIGFWEKTHFLPKTVKIAENCYHNICPRHYREADLLCIFSNGIHKQS